MKVGFDQTALHLTGGGIATYIHRLCAALEPRVDLKPVSWKPRVSRKRKLLRSVDTLYRERVWIPARLPQLVKDCNLLHSPVEAAPTNPKIPLVMTIHDLHPLLHPEHFAGWHGKSFARFMDRSLPVASAVITVSEFVRLQLLDRFSFLDPTSVTAVPHGVAPEFFAGEEDEAVREYYGLQKPYFLALGALSQNKNLIRLIEAYASIAHQLDQELLLAGTGGWKHPDIDKIIRRAGLAGRVRWLGFIPQENLPSLYAMADGFAFPSLYEGFGLPPLEAMAAGVPVLASHATCIPEVLGTAAILVDPYDVEAIADGLVRMVSSDALRDQMIDQGRRHAGTYTWGRTADLTVDVYRSVVGRKLL